MEPRGKQREVPTEDERARVEEDYRRKKVPPRRRERGVVKGGGVDLASLGCYWMDTPIVLFVVAWVIGLNISHGAG